MMQQEKVKKNIVFGRNNKNVKVSNSLQSTIIAKKYSVNVG